MNEVKKPVRGRVIAVVVAVCLLVGSAFALTPSIQDVLMPDPYGIMPLMLDDENLDRTVYFSDSIIFGAESDYGGGVTSFGPTSVDISRVDPSNGYLIADVWVDPRPHLLEPLTLSTPSDLYIDYSVDVSFSASTYKSLVVSGGFCVYLETVTLDSWDSLAVYPNSYQLLINEIPVGSIFDGDTDISTFADQSISLTSDVSSIGVRSYFGPANTVSSESYGTGDQYVDLFFMWEDHLTVVPSTSGGSSGGGDSGGDSGGDTGGDDSGSTSGSVSSNQVERVIAWLQNTYTAVNDIKSVLNPNNSGSVGSYIKESAEDTSNIASIFAREDDIKLRDDMDSILKEATSSFWSPAGEGETETEFDKATKVDKQKVTDIKNVGKGASALFDTGYGITDGFEAIATDDSFMSWFTAETANALDSTGQAVAVGDDDPYNMHFYYDQMQAIQNARGSD